METLKKFVKYYAPYKGVFFMDLLCAAIISFVDLAFPQILRSLTKTLFAYAESEKKKLILSIVLSVLSVDPPVLSVDAALLPVLVLLVLLSLELPHPATMDANIDAHNKVLITFFFIKTPSCFT